MDRAGQGLSTSQADQLVDMQSMRKVRVRKASEVVAGQIRNAIIRGEMKNGATLPSELQLIALFEVSRPTIREAIRILESENLISVSRGSRSGATICGPVAQLSARAIGVTLQARHVALSDVYGALALLGPPGARLAAESPTRGQTAEILREQIKIERTLLDRRSQFAAAMAGFHVRLIEQCGNKTIVLIAEALHSIVGTHNSLVYSRRPFEAADRGKRRRQAALRSHERLVELIESGDGAAAENHWRKHMKKNTECWLNSTTSAVSLNVLD